MDKVVFGITMGAYVLMGVTDTHHNAYRNAYDIYFSTKHPGLS